MNIKDPRHDVPIWNCGCAALICTTFSALLVEACNVRLGGPPRLHAICALVYLAQAAALLRSIRACRPGVLFMPGAGRRGTGIKGADIAAALLLAAFGYAGAAWLRSGWALPAILFAVLLLVFPWSRIPLCRDRLPLAGALTLLGGAVLFISEPAPAPLLLQIPAWMLLIAAGCGWTRLILLKHRKSRALAGYPASG
jgi:hypothetical protein